MVHDPRRWRRQDVRVDAADAAADGRRAGRGRPAVVAGPRTATRIARLAFGFRLGRGAARLVAGIDRDPHGAARRPVEPARVRLRFQSRPQRRLAARTRVGTASGRRRRPADRPTGRPGRSWLPRRDLALPLPRQRPELTRLQQPQPPPHPSASCSFTSLHCHSILLHCHWVFP